MTSNRFVLLVMFFFAVLTVNAQENYTIYKIKKGENIYRIARHFRVPVNQLLEINGLKEESILQVNQQIKIPSQNSVITQPATQPSLTQTDYQVHIVGPKETLWSISRKYGVTVDQIRAWNHLKNDNIYDGKKLIVAKNANVVQQQPITETPRVVKQPSVQKPTPPVQQVPEKKPVVVEKPKPVEQKPIEQKPVEQKIISNPVLTPPPTKGEGFFGFAYKYSGNQLSGNAATFKTASGWLDKKYYVLINNVPEGSVIAVTANNKTVYAKVLGNLPDIKEDHGVLFRISNAAAAELGINDTKFSAVISY